MVWVNWKARSVVLALLLCAAPVWAQGTVVDADRINLGNACLFRAGSGAPSGGTDCDTYWRTDIHQLYQRIGGTWYMLAAGSPAAAGTFMRASGSIWGASTLVLPNAATAGDLLYASGSNTIGALNIASAGQVLTSGAAPAWSATPSLTSIGGAANLTLNPTGDLVTDPTGNDILPTTNYDINIGSLSKKYLTLHAGELWVETLVAADTIATIGGRILVGPTTKLTADLASDSPWMFVKDYILASGDIAYLEANGQLEFIQVRSVAVAAVNQGLKYFYFDWGTDATGYFPAGQQFRIAGSTGNDGTYTTAGTAYSAPYTVVETVEAIPDATADGAWLFFIAAAGTLEYLVDRDYESSGTAHQWYAGDAVFNTGTTGDGAIDLYSVHGLMSATDYGPTITGIVRTGTAATNLAERWAIGNLDGLYGYSATTYGAAFGDPSEGHVTIDATNGFRIRHSTTTLLQADADGNLELTGDIVMGTAGVVRSGATAYDTGTGYWLAYNGGTPQFRIGTTTGAGTPRYLRWTGTDLELKSDTVTMSSSGISIAASSSVYGASHALTFTGVPSGRAALYDIYTSSTHELYLDAYVADSEDRATLSLYAWNTGETTGAYLTMSSSSSTGSVTPVGTWDVGAGTIDLYAAGGLNVSATIDATAYKAGGTAGVDCSSAGAVTTVKGIVTACSEPAPELMATSLLARIQTLEAQLAALAAGGGGK